MLAAVFIWGGLYTLRNPKPRVEATKSLFDKTAKFGAPISDANQENLVDLNAAVMVSAGALLVRHQHRMGSTSTLATASGGGMAGTWAFAAAAEMRAIEKNRNRFTEPSLQKS